VLSVETIGESGVYKISVAGAHTYETWGLASHNKNTP
jgi:hypothetical protein